MEITKIKENIYQYEFKEGTHNPIFGLNIFVIVNGNKALIIDTGYEEHAQKVKNNLDRKGIKVEVVILSHFHPDHISGSTLFRDSLFVGSKNYKINFNKSKKWLPGKEFIEPKLFAEDQNSLKFGAHKLDFIYTPGHSICSISTIIDDEILHVGDLVMETIDGKTVLPYLSFDGSFDEHIESLQMIIKSDYKIFLLSHGTIVNDKIKMNTMVEDRIYYLKSVKNSNGKLPLEECLKYDLDRYESIKFHQNNLKLLNKNI